MPSKRTYRSRNRRPPTPAWAEALKAGRLPERGTDDWSAYVSWRYFDDSNVTGLPDAGSEAGRELIDNASKRGDLNG